MTGNKFFFLLVSILLFMFLYLFLLVKNRLVRKMDVGEGRSLYEPRIDDEHHDHMICLDTGDIIEFYSKEFEDLQDTIAKKRGYKVIRHVHQLFVKPIK